MRLRYTNRANTDVKLALDWYEKQRMGLGFDFLDCLEKSILEIISYPEMHELSYGNFRRCIIKRFPFSIFYTIENEEIVIHSIFNNRQDPQKKPEVN